MSSSERKSQSLVWFFPCQQEVLTSSNPTEPTVLRSSRSIAQHIVVRYKAGYEMVQIERAQSIVR